MPYYKAVIEVLVDVDSRGEACDAIAEALRPLLRQYNDHADTAWIDWHYISSHEPRPHDGKGFDTHC